MQRAFATTLRWRPGRRGSRADQRCAFVLGADAASAPATAGRTGASCSPSVSSRAPRRGGRTDRGERASTARRSRRGRRCSPTSTPSWTARRRGQDARPQRALAASRAGRSTPPGSWGWELGDCATLLRHEEAARLLIAHLAPFRDQIIFPGHSHHGGRRRFIGNLLDVLGDLDGRRSDVAARGWPSSSASAPCTGWRHAARPGWPASSAVTATRPRRVLWWRTHRRRSSASASTASAPTAPWPPEPPSSVPGERREVHAALAPAAVAHPPVAVLVDDDLGGVGVDRRRPGRRGRSASGSSLASTRVRR